MTPSTATDLDAALHFAAKLRYETDPSDVHTALSAGEPFTLIDCRGDAAWRQGRIPGAVHLPTGSIPERAAELLAPGFPLVVYCWGPGCNGSTKAALALARLGHPVREMVGGFEYWAREGFPVVDDRGPVVRDPDPLTAPVQAARTRSLYCTRSRNVESSGAFGDSGRPRPPGFAGADRGQG